MKTVTPSDSDDHKQSSTKRHWKIGGSTPPRAVTWLTWPILFTFNIGLAMRAIMQHGKLFERANDAFDHGCPRSRDAGVFVSRSTPVEDDMAIFPS